MVRTQWSSVGPTAVHSRDRFPTIGVSLGSKACIDPLVVSLFVAGPAHVPALGCVLVDGGPGRFEVGRRRRVAGGRARSGGGSGPQAVPRLQSSVRRIVFATGVAVVPLSTSRPSTGVCCPGKGSHREGGRSDDRDELLSVLRHEARR